MTELRGTAENQNVEAMLDEMENSREERYYDEDIIDVGRRKQFVPVKQNRKREDMTVAEQADYGWGWCLDCQKEHGNTVKKCFIMGDDGSDIEVYKCIKCDRTEGVGNSPVPSGAKHVEDMGEFDYTSKLYYQAVNGLD